MSLKRKLILVAVFVALVAGLVFSTPKRASAIAPLEFDWDCAPPDGICDFDVTTTNHPKVYWTWGDGSSTGPTTSMSATHDYYVTTGGQNFTVTLVGYATVNSGSPDNITQCTIEAQGPSPGGNPGAHGHCQ